MPNFVLWDDIRIMLAIGEAGSFRSGAKLAKVALNTSRAAIDRLERRYGQVFERNVQGIKPTPLGEQLLLRASVMRATIEI